MPLIGCEKVEQADDVVELAYKLTRALGCSSPEEALKIVIDFAVKLNPTSSTTALRRRASSSITLKGRSRSLRRSSKS